MIRPSERYPIIDPEPRVANGVTWVCQSWLKERERRRKLLERGRRDYKGALPKETP